MPIQREIEKVERTYKEFPKKIDDRVNAILSGINSEYKSATLGFFLNDNWKTKSDIRGNAEAYVGLVDRIPSMSTFRSYCTATFIPIGAVAEERIKYKGRTNPVAYYKLTEDGEKYGKPIAQFSLKTAVDNNLSMYEIFGPTASPGETRSPLNIAKILFELEKEDNLREVDLKKKIGLDHKGVHKHLLNLRRLGFVDYESVSPEGPGWSQYEWIKGKDSKDVENVERMPTLTKKTANKMQEIGSSNCIELKVLLGYEDSERISVILSGLKKQGFVETATKFESGKKYSEASIKEKGRRLVGGFLEPAVYQALEDNFDTVGKGIEIFNDISTSCDYISKGFNLYRGVCPAYKRASKEENKIKILHMLEDQKKLRTKEIDKKLGKGSANYLKALIKEREITKERVGPAVYYSLKN